MKQTGNKVTLLVKGENGYEERTFLTKYVSRKQHLKVRNEKGEIIWNPRA
jgi:hypothetical protein